MVVIGLVLLLLGFLTGIAILWTLGIICLIAGLVLFALSFGSYGGGARPWYGRRWY